MTWLTRQQVEEAGFDRSKRAVWQYLSPLVFRSEKYGDVLIPPKFRTNYCSTPRLPFIFAVAGDKAHKPASLHDLTYTIHAILKVRWDEERQAWSQPERLAIDRQQADDLFLEALEKEPFIGDTLAAAMHKGVRWFGKSSWEDDTNILQPQEIKALMA